MLLTSQAFEIQAFLAPPTFCSLTRCYISFDWSIYCYKNILPTNPTQKVSFEKQNNVFLGWSRASCFHLGASGSLSNLLLGQVEVKYSSKPLT